MNFYGLYHLLENEVNMYVSYTGVVLDDASKQELLRKFEIPGGWTPKADHMTINTGPAIDGPAENLLNHTVALKVVSLASDNNVMAAGIETDIPIVNSVPHVTLAVSPVGKSVMSNDLKNWQPVVPFLIHGTIQEVSKVGEAPKQRGPVRPSAPPSPDDPTEFLRFLGDKPAYVKRMALRGKFPQMSDLEIGRLLDQ